MNVRALGPLNPDPHVPGWLVSEPKEIPFFDGLKLPFFLDALDEADEQEVESALGSFFKLGPIDREAASPYVFANYRRMAEMVDEEDLDSRIESEDDVWQHVHPSDIYISRRHRRDRSIYISIAAECDWEREHGLQIVYKKGLELTRVSDQDGHLTHTDAFDLPEGQDEIV